MVLVWGPAVPGPRFERLIFQGLPRRITMAIVTRLYISCRQGLARSSGARRCAVGCKYCDLCGDHAIGVVALDAVR